MTPQPATWEALTDRVGKLEMQNRRMKQAGAAALVLAAAVLLMGQDSPNRTVEANEFVLKDSGGNIRGAFAVLGDEPGLQIWDGNQDVRIALGLWDGAPSLQLHDANGVARAVFVIAPTGPRLVLADETGQRRAVLDVGTEGPGEHSTASSVVFFDKDGKVLWKAP